MSNHPRDYYELLGVPRTADAQALKKAFRQKAKLYHPDGSEPDPDLFREVDRAYKLLNDPKKRARYDRYGSSGVEGDAPTSGTGAAGFSESNRRAREQRNDIFDAARKAADKVFGGAFGSRNRSRTRDRATRRDAETRGKEVKRSVISKEHLILNPHQHALLLPESDYGIISALIVAMKAGEAGTWVVQKPEGDNRGYMPEDIAEVVRGEDGRITIRRCVTDFLTEEYRSRGVPLYDNRGTLGPKRKTQDAAALVDQEVLHGTSSRFIRPDALRVSTTRIKAYHDALRGIAEQIVQEGKVSISGEQARAIQESGIGELTNQYGLEMTRSNRFGENMLGAYTSEDFTEKCQKAGDLLRKNEGGYMNPEGKRQRSDANEGGTSTADMNREGPAGGGGGEFKG